MRRRWYESLRAKAMLLFIVGGLLYLMVVMESFSYIKSAHLMERAKERIALETASVIRELLVDQKREETLAVDIASVADDEKVCEVLPRLLKNFEESDIVSAGVWFEEDMARRESSCFFSRDESGGFSKIPGYERKSAIPFRKMEFYTIGRYLKRGETFWTRLYSDPVTHISMITVVSPIYEGKSFVGVASVDVSLGSEYDNIFSSLKDSHDRYFILRDRVGNIVTASSDILGRVKYDSEIFDRLQRHDSFDGNEELALKLAENSSEITRKEALRIAGEMEWMRRNPANSPLSLVSQKESDPILHDRSVLAFFYFPHTGWQMLVGISQKVVLKDIDNLFDAIVWTTVISSLLFALFGYFYLRMNVITPIVSLSEQLKKADYEMQLHVGSNDELASLAESFNERNRALARSIEERRTSEKLLMQQSKMAAIGEMLDAVAHQWKQPLSSLSLYADLLKGDYDDGRVDGSYIKEFSSNIHMQIDHMVKTLETFREFFRPKRKEEYFDISQAVEETLLLLKDDLMKNRVDVEVSREGKIEIFGSKNGFKHLLLNVISNARDACTQKGERRCRVTIRIIGDKKSPRVEIEDSAGGIDVSPIEKIFEPHFTTKEEGKGTGIGLYMSRQIAERLDARLDVENREEGACFILRFSATGIKSEKADAEA